MLSSHPGVARYLRVHAKIQIVRRGGEEDLDCADSSSKALESPAEIRRDLTSEEGRKGGNGCARADRAILNWTF